YHHSVIRVTQRLRGKDASDGCSKADNKGEVTREVVAFTDNVRQTGSYGGRAVEGFVVRCHDRNRPSDIRFFKVKYDEPYLMFRVWGQVTNHILSLQGMDNIVLRFELTRKYVEWLRRNLQTRPELFADFRQQKGIIRARDMFLKETNISGIGQHIVEEPRRTTQDTAMLLSTVDLDEEKKLRDELNRERRAATHNNGRPSPEERNKLLMIACIGAGKTTLARILKNLYANIEHIQSDNCRSKVIFANNVMGAFEKFEVVIADKNNHQSVHRQDVTRRFKKKYPLGNVVALDWQIEKMNMTECMRFSEERLIKRAENHQTLNPTQTTEFRKILTDFITKRQPLNLNSPCEKLIDRTIRLNFVDDPRVHIAAICSALDWSMPTIETLDAAVTNAFAQNDTGPVESTPLWKKLGLKPWPFVVLARLGECGEKALEPKYDFGMVSCKSNADKKSLIVSLAGRKYNDREILLVEPEKFDERVPKAAQATGTKRKAEIIGGAGIDSKRSRTRPAEHRDPRPYLPSIHKELTHELFRYKLYALECKRKGKTTQTQRVTPADLHPTSFICSLIVHQVTLADLICRYVKYPDNPIPRNVIRQALEHCNRNAVFDYDKDYGVLFRGGPTDINFDLTTTCALVLALPSRDTFWQAFDAEVEKLAGKCLEFIRANRNGQGHVPPELWRLIILQSKLPVSRLDKKSGSCILS
ncbi:hypothetical protein HK097_010904, partial [Rhizophlyctis rosea]